MTFLGEPNDTYETAIFGICASVSFLLFLFQIIYLQKLKSLSVRVLPILTLLVCYENCCSAVGDLMSTKSAFAKFSVTLIATILPLFIMVLFELPFRLHEARGAHFMCIPFEQGEGQSYTIAIISLVLVRIIAVGLFVVNVFVNLDILKDQNSRAGLGGYANIDEETESTHFWLSIVPSMMMAALALFISVLMQRYARNFTLGIRNSNHYWRYMLPCSVLYTVGQSFGAHIYRWTSMAGDVFMVIGISIMVHRVQTDLAVAGSFADFLHRSNTVFRTGTSPIPRSPKKRKSRIDRTGKQDEPPSTYVSPGDIHVVEMENGEKKGTEEEKEVVVDDKDLRENMTAGGSTALVKSDRDIMKRAEDEIDLYNDEEPELHAL